MSNPFIDAYASSDWGGKLIFLGLIALSVVSWSILLYKMWLLRRVRQQSLRFRGIFSEGRKTPLEVPLYPSTTAECPNAFQVIYEAVCRHSRELLGHGKPLAPADFELLEAQAASAIAALTKHLDSSLYVLSTVVTLAPFLGLLGTVYGILVTFGGMSNLASSQAVLSGLSLALTTTVIGLVDAIPALIGYNYLKNAVQDFDGEMDRFATEVLTAVQLRYR